MAEQKNIDDNGVEKSCMNCKYGDYDVDLEPCASCIHSIDYDVWEKIPLKPRKNTFGGGI